jgi:hypothetical protein
MIAVAVEKRLKLQSFVGLACYGINVVCEWSATAGNYDRPF